MTSIRQLTEAELDGYVAMMAAAYPGFGISTPEDRQRAKQRTLKETEEDRRVRVWGNFRDDEMLGCMKLYDYDMTLYGKSALVGGVGSVAVGLAHKKQHVARELIQFFLRHYREKGSCLTILYPFRHDFYKKMGFGYMTRMVQYSVKPESLPRHSLKQHITRLSTDDSAALLECYNSHAKRVHGMITKSAYEVEAMFARNHVYGYKLGKRVLGYVAFEFRKAGGKSLLHNNMFIWEFIYEPAALAELLAFLRSQSDQVDRIIFSMQDEHFYHLLDDPRNGTNNMIAPVYHECGAFGLGLMCRLIDIKRFFGLLAAHDFGGQSTKLKVNLCDTFLPEQNGSTVLHFDRGHCEVIENGDWEVEISMDVSTFSSLVMGDVGFATLQEYGIARISDTRHTGVVDRLFRQHTRPKCTTLF